MQRNGYRAQYALNTDGDFTDLFDFVLPAAIDFTTNTPLFTVAYDRPGTWSFEGFLFVRDTLTESFSVQISFAVTDAAAVVQFVAEAPIAANNAAGTVFTSSFNPTSGTFVLSSSANLNRMLKLYGAFQIVSLVPGTFEVRASKTAGAGAASVRFGSRLRGARIPS